jgi:transglutaminase-like putative cysteine protease
MQGTLTKNPSLDDTLRAMAQLAHAGKKDLRIVKLTREIVRGLEPGDYNSEIQAIYYWVCQNIRYVRDIHDVETVIAPIRVLELGGGDCDDMATLLAAMLMCVGNECRFMVVGFENRQPTHVFCQVALRTASAMDGSSGGNRVWATVDPVADELTASMHRRVGFARSYSL